MRHGVGVLGIPHDADEVALAEDAEEGALMGRGAALSHVTPRVGERDESAAGDALDMAWQGAGGATLQTEHEQVSGTQGFHKSAATPLASSAALASDMRSPLEVTVVQLLQAQSNSGTPTVQQGSSSVAVAKAELQCLRHLLVDLPPPGRFVTSAQEGRGGPPDAPGRDRIDWELLLAVQHATVAALLGLESILEAAVAKGLRPSRDSLSSICLQVRPAILKRYVRALADSVTDMVRQSVLVFRVLEAKARIEAGNVEAELTLTATPLSPALDSTVGPSRETVQHHIATASSAAVGDAAAEAAAVLPSMGAQAAPVDRGPLEKAGPS
jgi:hypothetical protein